jgi:hypothetical protein
MKEQGRKLMAMIGTAVNALSNVEAVVPAIQDIGEAPRRLWRETRRL